MGGRAVRLTDVSQDLIPYAPPRKSEIALTDAGDPVESAGQKILSLLNQAAEAANANTKHALDVAQKMSRELRIAQERVATLEADLSHYKERAESAEQWLRLIASEIEEKFFATTGRGRTA
jgi:hypothetical protein